MKQLLFALSLMYSGIPSLIAQGKPEAPDFRNDLMFGLKAGINYSNVYDSKGESFVSNPKTGIAAGAFLSIPFNRFIGAQPELLFSQKGFTGSGQVLGGGYQLTRTTNYVDVPLLFALKPHRFLTLLAGPVFSYLWRQTDEFATGSTGILQEQTFQNDNVRKNILGFTGGADITIGNMLFGLRAAWDVQANNGDGTSATPRYKNVWYQLTFGFRI